MVENRSEECTGRRLTVIRNKGIFNKIIEREDVVMGLHVEGKMYAFYLYGYDLTKYKDILTDEFLVSIGVDTQDFVPSDKMPYSLRFNDRLFVGYIITYLDDTAGSEIESLNYDDFRRCIEFARFEDSMKKISEKVGQNITEDPQIMCWTDEAECEEEDEDWDPYYEYLNYALVYGYDLNSIEKDIDSDFLEEMGAEALWDFKTGDYGFLIQGDYMQIPIGGYVVDKLKLDENYRIYDDFWKNISNIAKSAKMAEIESVVQKIYDTCGKKVPKLGYYAVKIDIPE